MIERVPVISKTFFNNSVQIHWRRATPQIGCLYTLPKLRCPYTPRVFRFCSVLSPGSSQKEPKGMRGRWLDDQGRQTKSTPPPPPNTARHQQAPGFEQSIKHYSMRVRLPLKDVQAPARSRPRHPGVLYGAFSFGRPRGHQHGGFLSPRKRTRVAEH